MCVCGLAILVHLLLVSVVSPDYNFCKVKFTVFSTHSLNALCYLPA